MFENVVNSVWHAFDYLSGEIGRKCAAKSKLKVRIQPNIDTSII